MSIEQEPIVEQQPPREPLEVEVAPGPYVNRELSWLDFNDRVLQLAEDPSEPLFERVKFAAIFSGNLDEFFMIRVAGLHDQVDAGLTAPKLCGLTPSEIIDAIRARVVELQDRQSRIVDTVLRPALAAEGIHIASVASLPSADVATVAAHFRRQIFPVLTPLAIGSGRPFPYISNLSLSLAVLLRDPVTEQETFARIKVPTENLPRFITVDGSESTFVALEDVIASNLDALFPGMEVLDHGLFRVTRDADFEISDEADDLLRAVEQELRRRRFGEAVRVEIDADMSLPLRELLMDALKVEERQVYDLRGLLGLEDISQIAKLPGHPAHRYEPWTPVTQHRLQTEGSDQVDMFAAIRAGDILVHHPYDSFSTSVDRFVEQAVSDPDVLAIKLTIYRTSDDTPLVPQLIRATERGKQAVCLVELKARFDERANIEWARKLEEAGVHVVFGHPALKTHTKCILVVRREGDGVRNYLHIGTGNYNPDTARLYTDFGLFTADPDLGIDVADLFNFLTGYARPRYYRKALVAPNHMRDGIIREIERTVEAKRRGEEARIQMKMNSLVDRQCIEALYAASRAGVPVRLNIRGICSLVPGIEGISENIEVVSVVGRFLEHSRIYAFQRGREERVMIGSADLMPRNLDTRVELVVPVADPQLRADLLDTLDRAFADNQNAWELRADGSWFRKPTEGAPRSLQRELMIGHARESDHE
ncbi:MAG TPA: polyphosphate kinase 1 [Baekduia sp.]|nr:polyphosphate kinase 1 [Baekduia sp.]